MSGWAGRERVLYVGGRIHSPASPFATAMLIDSGTIAWLGDDSAAHAYRDVADQVVHLAGALVTPGFVDAHVHIDVLQAARTHASGLGIVALHAMTGSGTGLSGEPDVAGPLVTSYRLWSPDEGSAQPVAEQVAEHLVAATAAGVAAAVRVGGAARDVGVGIESAASIVGTAALRSGGHRLELADLIDAATTAICVEHGIGLCVRPRLDEANRFADLVAAGAVLAFGSVSPAAPVQPWAAVRAAMGRRGTEGGLTARAAFAAHTRGGWRIAGRPDVGVLVPGAAAHLAVWDVTETVVQVPDDRVSAWSTDPRSGTPGLPALAPDLPLPACVRTIVDGAVVFDAGILIDEVS